MRPSFTSNDSRMSGTMLEVCVVADEARVAVDDEEPRVAAAPGERVQRAAMVAEGTVPEPLGACTTSGFCGRRFFDRRQLPGLHLAPNERRRSSPRQAASPSRQRVKLTSARARTEVVVCRRRAGRVALPRRCGTRRGQAAGSDALPCHQRVEIERWPRSGSGTAASSALV